MGCCITKKSLDDSFSDVCPLQIDNDLMKSGTDAPLIDRLKYSTTVWVVSVYDGDTFTVAMKSFIGPDKNQVVRVKCRLNGIDTPEMRPPKNDPNREKEIAAAKKSKQFVETNILHKYIRINVAGLDKYGRLLVSLALPDTGKDLATTMIEQKLGYAYDGGTKQQFS